MQFDSQEQKQFIMQKILSLPAENLDRTPLKLGEVAPFFAKYVQPFDTGLVIPLDEQIVPKKYKPKGKAPTPIKEKDRKLEDG